MLVHYHAYGDPALVQSLVESHGERILKEITRQEDEEVERLQAEYEEVADRLRHLVEAIPILETEIKTAKTRAEAVKVIKRIAQLEKQREKLTAKIEERDERIAETRRYANDNRNDVLKVGEELIALYRDSNELLKHTRLVEFEEIAENESNLNIPRYVDTFEPEPPIEVIDALKTLTAAETAAQSSEINLRKLLAEIGYDIENTN